MQATAGMEFGAGPLRNLTGPRRQRSRRGPERRDRAAEAAGYRSWDDFLSTVKGTVSCADVATRWGGIQLSPAGSGAMILCPFHDERTPSCHLDGPLFCCHGSSCGKSGDVLTFSRLLAGTGFVETVLALAGEFGLAVPDLDQPTRARRSSGPAARPVSGRTVAAPGGKRGQTPCDWPIGRPPVGKGPNGGSLHVWFRRGGFRAHRPTTWHEYRDMDGGLVALTARTNRAGGKVVLPITWRVNPATGWGCWTCGGFSSGRSPIYGRERLAGAATQAMLLVDGEKTADAANRLLGGLGWAAVSVMGGCRSAHRADWSDAARLVLQTGRRMPVAVWPDADRPSPTQDNPAAEVADRLLSALAEACGGEVALLANADCRVVNPGALPRRRHGWALDDAEAEGLDSGWAAGCLDRAVPWKGSGGTA